MNTVLQRDTAGDEQLLITSVRTGKTEIFRVDLRWGDLKNLTRSAAGENRYPMWSPDGSQIVFTSDRDTKDTYDLFVMDAEGANVRRLTKIEEGGICYFPSWSGPYIYYGYAPPRNGTGTICRVSAEGSGQSVIGEGRDPCISPDGKSLAYTQLVKEGYSLYRMDANGRNSVRLTDHQNPIGAVAPVWSPDGKQLLYSDSVEGKLEIFACGAAGDNQRQLTHLGQYAASAAWSPDMLRISFRLTDHDYWRYPDAKEYVYRVKQADKRPVWMMNADGSDARVVESLRYHCALDGSRAGWKPRS
jgi:Tol biopolymer transport system component